METGMKELIALVKGGELRLFFSAGTVANSTSALDINKLKVGGAGVRFLLFKNKDIFTRFDVAFSEDGPGFYFFIGESF